MKIRNVVLAFAALWAMQTAAAPLTFTVTNTLNSGAGSLRQAIIDSNANNPAPGVNTIVFNILVSDPGYQADTNSWLIIPATEYPTITRPVIVDGYSQPGSTANTNPINAANNATLTIELRGPGAGQTAPPLRGLRLGAGSDGSTIKGLVINSFARRTGNGIQVDSNNCAIEGNFLGTDVTGTLSRPNFNAVVFVGSGNRLGGGATLPAAAAARNLISGSYGGGGVVRILGANSIIQGNTVGIDRSGTQQLMPEGYIGIVSALNTGTLIGGPRPENRNVISGHNAANIFLNGAIKNTVQNNITGLDVTGAKAVPENGIGIIAITRAQAQSLNIFDNNTVAAGTYGIVIGENSFSFFPEIDAQVTNNKVGTDITGTVGIPNSLDGIALRFALNTYLANNIVSANGGNGIIVGKAKNTTIRSNRIGTDITGTVDLGNQSNGIQLGTIVGAGITTANDVIGGAKPRQGNLIAFNKGNGIALVSFTQNETIQGNTIFANSKNGIYAGPNTQDICIGGFMSRGDLLILGDIASQIPNNTNLGPLGTSNVILENGKNGIHLRESQKNKIQANLIDSNNGAGIVIEDSCNNLIGGSFDGFGPVLGNVIINNNGYGVAIAGTSQNNTIITNTIADNSCDGIKFACKPEEAQCIN